MMGGQSSNKKGVEPPPPPPPPPPPQLPPPHLHLISYEEAYRLDPDFQYFDSSLREMTNRVLSLLSTGIQDVRTVMLPSKADIRKNEKLFSLGGEYFESSAKTLQFCAILEIFLKRARNSILIIQVALRKFEEEVALYDGVVEMNFKKTLEQLGKFEGAGAPFSEFFFVLFESVYRQQVSMLEKLEVRKKELDNSLWNNYMLKVQKELVSSMQAGTHIAIQDVNNIRLLINKLEVEFDSLLQYVNFALIDKDALKIVIDEIEKKKEFFMETIGRLGEQASECRRNVTRARTLILQRG